MVIKALLMISQTEDKDSFIVKNRDLSMFTQAERDTLTNSFPSTSQDIKDYDSYRKLVGYLVSLYSIFLRHTTDLVLSLFRFYTLIAAEFKGEELTELYNLEKVIHPK